MNDPGRFGDLSREHLQQLQASGLSAETIHARGYRTVTRSNELTALHFSRAQARVPALLIPLYNVQGESAGFQIRPDEPRTLRGEPAKYESLPRTPLVLDVNPLCRERLADPKVRLWVTEGSKKGDALVTVGEVAIALNGVYGWRGRNQYGGLVANPDWEYVPVNERDVILVFDSDLATNRNVASALSRLQRFLQNRRARVRIVYLRPGVDGAKVGIDDYLVAGGTLEQLLAGPAETATEAQIAQPVPATSAGPDHLYKVTPFGIEVTRFKKNVPYDFRLTNFAAEIAEDVDIDDGVESTRHLVIRAKVRGREMTVTVPASEFSSLNWVMSRLGAGAIISPGFGAHDETRAAIQYLSPKAQRRTAFAHLGWRQVDGEWLYLHAGGGITSQGLRTDVAVELPPELRRYELPDPASVNLREAFNAVIRFRDLMGPARAWRLLSLVFAATIAELLPPDFIAWIWGRTGTFKSTAAALISNFFGVFDRLTLPGNLKSTANATEALAFVAKDVVFTVDDFAPSTGQGANAAQELTVFKLIRAVGDRHARNRMRADRSIVGGKPPRGLVVVTAEMTPPAGQSTQARCFEIAWDNVGIDTTALAWAQEHDRPLYAAFTAAFVQDVAGRFATLKEELPGRVRALRSEFDSSHRRIAETATKLIVAVEVFLEFVSRSELISEAERLAYIAEATDAISSAANRSSEAAAERNPVALLLDGLRIAFALQQAHLDDLSGGPPRPNPERWGYGNGAPGHISVPIGWFDSETETVYVVPSAALRCAARALGDDAGLPQSVRAVGELLKGDRKLARTEGTRSTVVARVASARQRVWALRAKDFLLDETVPTVSTVPGHPEHTPATPMAENLELGLFTDPGDDDDDPSHGGNGGSAPPPLAQAPVPAPSGTASKLVVDIANAGAEPLQPSAEQMGLAPLEVRIASVTSTDDLASLITAISAYRGPIGVDVETSGLDPRADRLRLVQVALGEEVYVVDAFAVDIQPLATALAGHELVGHNLLFDLSFLHRYGVRPGRVFDTFLASQILNSGVPHEDGYHGLQALVARELGLYLPKELQRSDWTAPLSDGQLAYAARDARAALLVRDALIARLAADDLARVADIENRCLPSVVNMSLRGVPIDTAAWRLDNARDAEALAAADRELSGLLNSYRPGAAVNWRSSKQVLKLFSDLGVALTSTAAETLSRVDHPLARALTRRGHLAQRTATWGEKFFEYVRHDRVYPEWKQLGAESGRMSCVRPPLQAIPRDGYKAHIRPAPGFALVDGDYSQIEMRLGAKIANEPRLIELFLRDADLHEATARLLVGRNAITKEERSRAKACNFGFLFGMGPRRFQNYARSDYGVELTESDATRFRERFFAAYPNLRRWHSEVGRSTARSTRTLSGRRRFLPATHFTARVNTPVQGTCADGLKQALALLWERRAEHPAAVPVLAVHDQIVIETTPEDAEGTREWLVKAMTDGMREFADPVPVKVDTEIVTSKRKEE